MVEKCTEFRRAHRVPMSVAGVVVAKSIRRSTDF